jgi:hypothetical protein
MLHFREFVMPLLVAPVVGILVWAYLDRRLRNTLLSSNARSGLLLSPAASLFSKIPAPEGWFCA